MNDALDKLNKCKLAIFASGTGSNFVNIYNYILKGQFPGEISLLISNNSRCKAIAFAKKNGINYKIINKSRFSKDSISDIIFQTLDANDIDIIILAGYMKKIPENIVNAYSNRILNIHPALLPKFGGKGFYGIKVHEAVINSKEKYTGITIHFVDKEYDTGSVVYQEKINVMDDDSPSSLASRVLELEHEIYPKVIKQVCENYIKEMNW